jgi:hypothetical protein
VARIRTIKPEFPQSESMGKVSRDARLLFVQMWTLADDSGRLRGNSRMLASLLFPYDDDAPSLISGWLSELERENCIVRYEGPDQSSYVQVCKWKSHQKIDKPSESKIPPPESCPPREPSRKVANALEPSIPSRARADQDQGPGRDQGEDQGPRKGEETALSFAMEKSGFKSPAFRQTFAKWREYSHTAKQKFIDDITAEVQIMSLAKNAKSEEDAIGMILYTIERNVVGLIMTGEHRNRDKTALSTDGPQSRFAKPKPVIPTIS